MQSVRKYLNYLIFGAVVLLVVGLAVNHSRHMRSLVDALASGNPELQKPAATELIDGEQFMDSITGEPVSTRIKAAQALEALGDDKAVKQCIAFLKDPDKPVRDQIVHTLKTIGWKTPKNVDALVAGLKDGDPYVRKGTIDALTNSTDGIGPKPGVVASIVKLMKAEAGARGPGGDVLGSASFTQHGANAESVPSLIALLQDKDEGVRSGAADALGKIGDPQAIPVLKDAMHKDTAQVRRVSIGAIALIADKSGEDALTEALKNTNDDNESRAQAAAGLGKIATPTAIATLTEALRDDDQKLRSAAVAALARAARPDAKGPTSPPVMAALNSSLRDKDEDIRLGAAEALQSIASPEANPALISILETQPTATDDADTVTEVRIAAATALGFDGNEAAVAPLIRALSDPTGEVATAAQDALGKIGPKATDALIATIKRGGTDALYASNALVAQGVTVLPALKKAADDPNPVSQRWAAVALGELGIADARPTLQQLEKSTDPDVAFVAKQQLDRLGRAD